VTPHHLRLRQCREPHQRHRPLAKRNDGSGFAGYDYRTHAQGSGNDTFTWKLHIPADGTYAVYVKYPAMHNAATSASFKVFYHGGSYTTAVNQAANTGDGGWVRLGLGTHNFTQADTGQKVTLMGFTGSAGAGHQARAGDSVPVAAGG
jgi:hypothetical protein